jgi:predicted nuclease with TOPRIM domain
MELQNESLQIALTQRETEISQLRKEMSELENENAPLARLVEMQSKQIALLNKQMSELLNLKSSEKKT